MRTGPLSPRTLLVAALSVVTGACGNAAGGDSASGGSPSFVDGSGGVATGGGGSGNGMGGTLGSGGNPMGGTSNFGGSMGPSGGVTSTGGTAVSGGSTGGAEQVGGTPSTGGQASIGGQAGTGGVMVGSGGQAELGTGGMPQAGGTSGTGGLESTGGQAGFGTGGDAQAGGTAAGGGQSEGGEAGLGTGGGAPTGGTAGVGGQTGDGGRLISFGTLLDPQAVMTESQELAQSLADPSSPQWQATGDQHRTYTFAEASTEEPYRLYVPTDWDGQVELPLVMFLHGAGSNESTYLDQNNQQMLTLAQQYGFLLVSPMGDQGAYGNFLRLTAPFGDEQGAAELMAQVTADSERINQLSEKDVINVLELILAEYPIDRASMFLTGHSMGSGGTWYIGGKYADYWRALAPMSGPFVQESGYPWDSVRPMPILVTEGTQTPSLDASRLLGDWLTANGFDAEYLEVDADHGGMVPLVLPDVFDFFDRARAN
jgi:poly(3-hydroxybutyrate) depolymerase